MSNLQVSYRQPAKPGQTFDRAAADAMVGQLGSFDADPRFMPEGEDPHITGKVIKAEVIEDGQAVRVTIERDTPDPDTGSVVGHVDD